MDEIELRMAIVGYGDRDQILPVEGDETVPGVSVSAADAHKLVDNELADPVVGSPSSSTVLADLQGVPGDVDLSARSSREEIDAYGKRVGIDTTGAGTKAEALALLGK